MLRARRIVKIRVERNSELWVGSPERAKEFSKGCNPLMVSSHHTIEPRRGDRFSMVGRYELRVER